jgi:hypothetical protein
MKTKKGMEYWWNDADSGKPKRATGRKPFPVPIGLPKI